MDITIFSKPSSPTSRPARYSSSGRSSALAFAGACPVRDDSSSNRASVGMCGYNSCGNCPYNAAAMSFWLIIGVSFVSARMLEQVLIYETHQSAKIVHQNSISRRIGLASSPTIGYTVARSRRQF